MVTHVAHAQDVTVGKPCSPQLAKAVFEAQEAFQAMKGQPFLLETKFDGETCIESVGRNPASIEPGVEPDCCRAGERLQMHCNGGEIKWYGGRQGINHAT